MSKKYRIGIIGVGAIARIHAMAIRELSNAQLVAGSCRTEEKGRKFVAEFGGSWYGSAEEMLDRAGLDVAIIATPSGAHLEGATAAMKRGVHLLIEKPLEITTERCDQIIAGAKAAGVTLGCIFPQRFNPVTQAVHAAAKAGRFGQLAIANAYVPWWRDDKYYAPERWQGKLALDGGGAMMNQSIHSIDLMQWLSEAAGSGGVAEVFGFTGVRSHDAKVLEVEDTAVACLRYRSGAMGVILAATSMWPGTFQRFHMAGRDGTAEVHEDVLVTWKFREEKPEDAALREMYQKPRSGGGAGDPMAIDFRNHQRNIAEFLEAIEQKRQSSVSGDEARKSVAIVEAVYRAAKGGQSVKVM
jgi:predicted dehydrogenase